MKLASMAFRFCRATARPRPVRPWRRRPLRHRWGRRSAAFPKRKPRRPFLWPLRLSRRRRPRRRLRKRPNLAQLRESRKSRPRSRKLRRFHRRRRRRKKVAHFITAEAADSTLRLAADGKLPELHLEEVAGKKAEAKSKSMNPLVVAAALSVSVTLSAVLLLVGTGQPSAAGSQQKALMRQKIEANYFSADENKELEAYQVLLRDAQRAFTRGDYRSERQDYRRVLDMLRAERGSQEKGLTGSRTRDHELEDAISVLLSGG